MLFVGRTSRYWLCILAAPERGRSIRTPSSCSSAHAKVSTKCSIDPAYPWEPERMKKPRMRQRSEEGGARSRQPAGDRGGGVEDSGRRSWARCPRLSCARKQTAGVARAGRSELRSSDPFGSRHGTSSRHAARWWWWGRHGRGGARCSGSRRARRVAWPLTKEHS
jgi:hypothetical protein